MPLSKLAAGLYVVATPIGNLGDVSERAKSVIKAVGLVLCEDTRVTGKLLHLLGLKQSLMPYHDHSGPDQRQKIIKKLQAGETIALVSDAGTPCLADPGFKLVREAREAGIDIYSVPGASSVTAALSIAGMPTDRFFFQGFLPSKSKERLDVLDGLKLIPGTLVILEAPTRIAASLKDCLTILGPRPAALARELTKLHEEVRSGTLKTLFEEISALSALKGEIVLLIGAPPERAETLSEEGVDEALRRALLDNKPGRAAAIVAELSGISRDILYKRALLLKS